MHRILGKPKPTSSQPAYTLDDAAKSMGTRTEGVDSRIKKLDDELMKYKQQLSKMRPGPAKNQIQQRAIRVLQQKKVYEKQRETLYGQQFNIDQTNFAMQSVKDNSQLVDAMKGAKKELTKGIKQMNVDEVEDLHDDMTDLMEDNDEINDIMSRQYGVPEMLDEDDLMAELNGLEDELELDTQQQQETPDYLVNAASASKNPIAATKSNTTKTEQKNEQFDVDEFGLPSVPVRQLNA